MSRFLTATMTDIRTGRETWRVFLAVCLPSFALAVAAALMQRLG